MKIESHLKSLDIELPSAPVPLAAYVPCRQVGNLVYVSGQGPVFNGHMEKAGKIGVDLTPEEGKEAARVCGLNIIAQLKQFLGDLDRVKSVVQLMGFVACADTFTGQPSVVNGASELMVEVFGEAGRHTRYALGANTLPRDFPVEIGAVVEIDG